MVAYFSPPSEFGASDWIALGALAVAFLSLYLAYRERIAHFRQSHHDIFIEHLLKFARSAAQVLHGTKGWMREYRSEKPNKEKLKRIGETLKTDLAEYEVLTSYLALLMPDGIVLRGNEFLIKANTLLNTDRETPEGDIEGITTQLLAIFTALLVEMRMASGVEKLHKELSDLLKIPNDTHMHEALDEHMKSLGHI